MVGEWTLYIEEDEETHPKQTKAWDECSEEVLVKYTDKYNNIKYTVAYLDWNDYWAWYSTSFTGRLNVIEWTYFNKA